MDIEALLLESEGTSLDFKRDQYPFGGATNEEKGELLKDILAFANAFRRVEAVILLGVQEATATASAQVVGVSHHLSDADLQQFVNSKTNVPLSFAYKQYTIKGKQVGAIEIPRQKRPIYAKKDFGRVKAEAVYYRLGSSTAIADPSVIAAMVTADVEDAARESGPVLMLRAVSLEDRRVLSEPLSFSVTATPLQDPQSYPDYNPQSRGSFAALQSVGPTNKDYWRETANWIRATLITAPLGFSIENLSGVVARNVRLAFEIEGAAGTVVLDSLPDPPRKLILDSLSPRFHGPSNASVATHGGRFHVEVKFGDVQPKATVWARSPVFIGRQTSGAMRIDITIFADNLPEPTRIEWNLDFVVKEGPAITVANIPSFLTT